jgi:hypothetical protein
MRRRPTRSAEETPSPELLELARLRAFTEEFSRLIELHDRTPERWKYFQTEWLWLYLRGLVNGEWPKDAQARRLAELEAKRQAAHDVEINLLEEEAAALCNSAHVVRYSKAEMYGGPADGQINYVTVPAADFVFAYAKSIEGRTCRTRYRRRTGAHGDVLEFPAADLDARRPNYAPLLEEAFVHKIPTIYDYCPTKSD